ncbi:MAG: glycosyltransferase family 2 protein [Thermoleophilia bacterium]
MSAGGRAAATPRSGCDVGIVIATCDRGELLLATLERLVALPERAPVVVVDNAAPRDLAAIVRAAGHDRRAVEVITLPHDHGPAARTIGSRRLATELVAFCDDDSWFAPGALARAADRFAAEPRLGLLQARVLVGADERLDPTCARVRGSPALLGFVACGAVLRRRALLEVGGFAPGRSFGGEERRLALDLASAGWKAAYDADVVAHHHPLPDERRRGRRSSVVRNDLQTAWSRLPWRLAARATRQAACRRPLATASALLELPRALRERRPVSPAVAAALRAIERHERANPVAQE